MRPGLEKVTRVNGCTDQNVGGVGVLSLAQRTIEPHKWPARAALAGAETVCARSEPRNLPGVYNL